MAYKKGQAAMEYLMTYGWAILIVLAIMGILVYLVRPQQVESCSVATPFQCQANQYVVNKIGTDTIVRVNILNLGSVVYTINATACPSDGSMRALAQPVQISPGSNGEVTFNCTASTSALQSPTAGKDYFQDTMMMQYYASGAENFGKSTPIEIVVRYS